MQPTLIEAKTLPEAWFLCLKELVERSELIEHLDTMGRRLWEPQGIHQYTIDRGSFKGGQRLEFDYITIHVEFPNSRPLVPDVPLGIPAPVTQEYIENYLPYLMTDKVSPNEQYTYGQYLWKQIPQIIKMYKEGGYNTNQAFMAVGDENSINQNDPPCLRGIDTRIQNGKLHFMVYFRSWDLWGGFPANLGGIQILKEYMASEIGVEDGEIFASSKGLHLYDTVWELAKMVVRR